MSLRDVIIEALWRPIQTMLLDPSIGFTAVYTALIYGIYYSFFEAFPIVYLGMYGFNLGQMGLAFLSIIVGALLGVFCYWAYVYWVVEPDIRVNGLGAPERRLIPALVAAFFLPIGLFIFGMLVQLLNSSHGPHTLTPCEAWTSNPAIHWIVPTFGIGLFTISIFIVMQCIFLYLPLSYPQYAASLFAGNDFLRSTLATGTIHFARPLYINLGVGRGVSLLSALACACIAGIYVLYFFGAWLRQRSRFAAK
jgi:DHA1 family multidrug resistance protein-like MFS transporter